MNSSRLFLLASALALATAAIANEPKADATADGARRLGRPRLGFTADHYRLTDAAPFDSSGRGYTIEAAVPVAHWLDVGLEHYRAAVDGPGSLALERHATLFSATWHGARWGAAHPFFTAGYGTFAQETGVKEKDQAVSFVAGAELPLGRRFTLTPAVERFQALDLPHEEWRVGLALDWHVAKHVSVTLRARHGDIEGVTKYQRYALGLTFLR